MQFRFLYLYLLLARHLLDKLVHLVVDDLHEELK